MANRAAGKGYENELFYENTKFHFLGIENIHTMRASLQKLVESCEQKSMTGFLSSLESSGWLKHIRAMLDTSCFIANAIFKGISVVVHCSDGWDRTSQVCSLAALMLDPFYRTIKGFQALIEKDWLSYGHKFSERNGHLQTDPKEVRIRPSKVDQSDLILCLLSDLTGFHTIPRQHVATYATATRCIRI